MKYFVVRSFFGFLVYLSAPYYPSLVIFSCLEEYCERSSHEISLSKEINPKIVFKFLKMVYQYKFNKKPNNFSLKTLEAGYQTSVLVGLSF